MPATLGPRFVLEAGFLILLAVVVGFAVLKPVVSVLVMAIAWFRVALIEYFAWRQGPRVGAMRRFATAGEPPPVVQEEVVQEEVVEARPPPPPPPPPEPPPPPAEEETVIEPPPAAPGDLPPSESERPP